MLQITGIHELSVPLSGDITNAVVNFSAHDVSLVAMECRRPDGKPPVVGYAFNSIGRFAQPGILNRRLIPRVLTADPMTLLNEDGTGFDPAAVVSAAMKNEKPGGHGDRAGAVAALELATWDLNAKLADLPAWRLIADATGTQVEDTAVSTYAAGGYYYSGDSVSRLQEELRHYLGLGFDAVKIKIGGIDPGQDLIRMEAAVEVTGSGKNVAVDANGRFDLNTARTYQAHAASLDLRWYEEPCNPLDFELMRQLATESSVPLATGENLFSQEDAGNLVRYAGLRTGRDVFQMDPGLSYGLTEYLEILSMLDAAGHDRSQCFPHGGHLVNLHIAAGLGLGGCEAYPGVFSPFGGFSPDCKIHSGKVTPGDSPGFGLEMKPELRPFLDKLKEKF